jgi:hypothetical protein
LRGRWYRLAVRAFRKGIIDYGKWTGTRLDHHRERLLLEDLETEMLEAVAAAPPDRRQAMVSVGLPWYSEDQGPGMDPDAMYEEAMRSMRE